MNAELRNKLLRTVCHALRHDPEQYYLEMDEEGWVDVDMLLLALSYLKPEWSQVSIPQLQALYSHHEVQRFEIAGSRIRALYGHSVLGVQVGQYAEPPAYLYHGTALSHLPSIRATGLCPIERRYVQLTSDWVYASAIAQCKGGPAVMLLIAARQAWTSGVEFYEASSSHWISPQVPSEFIEELPIGKSPAQRR